MYALIQQPTHGWGDPIVFVPLIAGIALFALFLVWESRAPHAMLDLTLFRIRNFSVTNIETLTVYAGLMGAFFFVTLFLQETLGYSPLEAGFATTPISLLLFVLSPRFGKIATGIGPAGADVGRPDRRGHRPADADRSRRRLGLPHRGAARAFSSSGSASRRPWRR